MAMRHSFGGEQERAEDAESRQKKKPEIRGTEIRRKPEIRNPNRSAAPDVNRSANPSAFGPRISFGFRAFGPSDFLLLPSAFRLLPFSDAVCICTEVLAAPP
jgi:hypothetical protein